MRLRLRVWTCAYLPYFDALPLDDGCDGGIEVIGFKVIRDGYHMGTGLIAAIREICGG